MTTFGRRRMVTLGLIALVLSCGKTDPVGEAIESAKHVSDGYQPSYRPRPSEQDPRVEVAFESRPF